MNIIEKAREGVQERLVVVQASAGAWGTKWLLAIVLIAFLTGGVTGYRWGTASFRKFQERAAAMQAEQDKRNKQLAFELEDMRQKFEAASAENNRADAEFESSLGPASDECLVPSKTINEVIARANN